MAEGKLAAFSATPRELKISTFRPSSGQSDRNFASSKPKSDAASALQHVCGSHPDDGPVHLSLPQVTDECSQIQRVKDAAASSIQSEKEMSLYKPNTFVQRRDMMWQCVKIKPFLSRDYFDRETKQSVPRGIGRVQKWINRERPRSQIKRAGPKNMFDGTSMMRDVDRPGQCLLASDGPPALENGWMGNLAPPSYVTTHREAFQNEQNRRRRPIAPAAVVRLGYGHLDALERRFQTTYKHFFSHPGRVAN